MLAVALHLRGQELSLGDIASSLVIATGKRKGQHPSPATVMRMPSGHDERAAAAAGSSLRHPCRSVVVIARGVRVAQFADGTGGEVGRTKLWVPWRPRWC